jgi:folate-binding protein YgfZ
MVDHETMAPELATLLDGRGFVDVSQRRKIRVSGPDAIGWLHDLLTADIAGLVPGASCRSLLLTPTGRIRADIQVLRRVDDVVLVQAPDQPDDIGSLLDAYVLSAAVSLDDTTAGPALFALPGVTATPEGLSSIFAPSCLGPGFDVLAEPSEVAAVTGALVGAGLTRVDAAAAEAWRIVRGVPRMGPEFDQRSLPAEAGLEQTIDTTKGCFLGQESIARVRNLGHPPHVLRHVQGERSFDSGASVFADSQVVGIVTSSTIRRDTCIGFVRITWAARGAQLTDADGAPLLDVSVEG